MIEIIETDRFFKWRTELERSIRSRVEIRIRRLSLGNFGDVKPVGAGISEMRIDYGPGYRIYLKKKEDTIYILLLGGDKRRQNEDIALAKKMAQEI